MIHSYSTVRRVLSALFFFVVSDSRGAMILDGSVSLWFLVIRFTGFVLLNTVYYGT